MNRFYRLTRLIILTCTTLLAGGAPMLAQAGGFADAFRDFVLGSQADAATLAVVQLPANSRSDRCMQCHNGSAGPHVTMKPAGAPMRFRGQFSIDHPVGMDYTHAAYRNPGTYVAPARLDKRIVFEDGKVTCVSCHQTDNTVIATADTLSPGNGGARCTVGKGYTTGPGQTRLCMSCHAM